MDATPDAMEPGVRSSLADGILHSPIAGFLGPSSLKPLSPLSTGSMSPVGLDGRLLAGWVAVAVHAPTLGTAIARCRVHLTHRRMIGTATFAHDGQLNILATSRYQGKK